jgi:hypothetical protein
MGCRKTRPFGQILSTMPPAIFRTCQILQHRQHCSTVREAAGFAEEHFALS